VDITSDRENCGACGKACSDGMECTAGKCGCPAYFSTLCEGQCVSTDTDPKNCGKCGFSCGSGSCDSGACGVRLNDTSSGASTCQSACAALGGGFACGTATMECDYYDPMGMNGMGQSLMPTTCSETWGDASMSPELEDLCSEASVNCVCTHS
jgi:hypothetical protein